MVIAHNMLAHNTNRQSGINDKKLKTSVEKLSSGYKINRAADDAAGLAMSEKMRRQIRGLDQGTDNMQDGASWVQIGDGAMEQVNDILHRMTELSVKGANGTLSDSDREALDAEMQQLKIEINRINHTTKFNDMRIFSTQYEEPEQMRPEFSITSIKGKLDDLEILDAAFDEVTGDLTYGGIQFCGNQVSWDEIAPDKVYMDGEIQKFHEGTWNYTDDQGRKLIFTAKEGCTAPSITREFNITAGPEGLRIDGDLINWSDVKNEKGEAVSDSDYVNGTWTAQYHGLTLSFDIDNAYTGITGMIEAINGGHDDEFRYKAYATYTDESSIQAISANMRISSLQVSKGVAEKIAAGESYFLRADADEMWLESYNPATGSSKKIEGSQKRWEDMVASWNSGSDIQGTYRYSDRDGTNDTLITFSYTIAAGATKESVIEGIDGVELSYSNVKTNYGTTLSLKTGGSVVSGKLTQNTLVSLQNELDLARNFGSKQYVVGTEPLQYDTATGRVTLSYPNASGANVITYQGSDAALKKDMAAYLEGYEEQAMLIKIKQALEGLPSSYDLGNKDLKDYLGPNRMTSSGLMNDTVTIDESTMVLSDGTGNRTALGYRVENGETYGCARIDFSGLTTAKDIWGLVGSGFDTTCNTCQKHYSVKFVMDIPGGGESRLCIDTKSNYYPLEISISSLIAQGVDNGTKLAAKIVEIASNTVDPDQLSSGKPIGFDHHYQQYAAQNGVLYIHENRNENSRPPDPTTGKKPPSYKPPESVSATFYTKPYKPDYPQQNQYTLELGSASNGTQTIEYTYDHSGYADRISGIKVDMVADNNGDYIMNASGKYEKYVSGPGQRYKLEVRYEDQSGQYDSSVKGTKTFTVDGTTYTVSTVGDIGREEYVSKAVQDMTGASSIRLASKDFTRADFQGKVNGEQDNSSVGAYYMMYNYAGPGERILESIRIQKSGDVPNYLSIPKFSLNSRALGLTNANCLTSDASRNTIDMVSYALKDLNRKRSIFGSLQNRMEHAINSNENTSENTTAGESRIRDTDMAKEMISFSNSQIVSQSIQAMLAQANQTKQGVLNLLG